jgi:hypothetical protein
MSEMTLSVAIKNACKLIDDIRKKVVLDCRFSRNELEEMHERSLISKQQHGPGLKHVIEYGYHKYF